MVTLDRTVRCNKVATGCLILPVVWFFTTFAVLLIEQNGYVQLGGSQGFSCRDHPGGLAMVLALPGGDLRRRGRPPGRAV